MANQESKPTSLAALSASIAELVMSAYQIGIREGAEQSVDSEEPLELRDEAERDEAEPDSNRMIAWGQLAVDRYGIEFIEGVLWIEAELGINANYLMACMMFESRLDHTARNPMSTASGLIQFMAFTARELGTTIEAIRSMDVMTQLSYVYRYFKRFADRGMDLSQWNLEDTYMAILWPAGISKGSDHAIFVSGRGRAYAVNKGLDANRDGKVTVGEAAAKVRQRLDAGLMEQNALRL